MGVGARVRSLRQENKLTVREFILFQIYSVRLSGGCATDGPRAGALPMGDGSTAGTTGLSAGSTVRGAAPSAERLLVSS